MVVWCTKCGKKRANHKKKGRGIPLTRCVSCKEEGMIKISGTCIEEGCSTSYCFNFPGEKIGKYCAKHKKVGMIDVKHKKCKYPGCKVRPSFNFKGYIGGIYCTEHKEEDMIDVVNKMCEFEGCDTVPNFNFEDEPRARFCVIHKEPDMIDVNSLSCIFPECTSKQPKYNVKGKLRGIYCLKHKKSGMIDVQRKRCEYLGCGKVPCFNVIGELHGRFCVLHKESEMVDVVSRRCEQPGCRRQPVYNFEGQKTGIYCILHKKFKMIDVESRRCKEPGCKTRPSFNFKGQRRGDYCFEHKKPKMINVVNKRCGVDGCNTGVFFGLLFSRPTRCAKHKTPNMVSCRFINPKCQHNEDEPCSELPFYAPPDSDYPTHCENHAPSNYINIVETPCEECDLPYFLPEGQTKCQYCLGFTKPEIVHAKELRIKSILEANNIPITTHDITPDDFCSKKRPDFTIDCGHSVIVLEVDEHQHTSYPCDCEDLRMIQIHQEYGGLPAVFIRYNPDSYINHLGRMIKGNSQNPKREKRLVDLIQRIRLKKDFVPMSVYYVCYNGDNGIDTGVTIDYFNNEVCEIEE